MKNIALNMGWLDNLFGKKKILEERLKDVGVTILALEPTVDFKRSYDAYQLSGTGKNEYDAENSLIKMVQRNGRIKYVEGVYHYPKPQDQIGVRATGYGLKK